MRKLRKKQELQDKRDRIRMGLLPPDPTQRYGTYYDFTSYTSSLILSLETTVRLANLMKVLTSDAVQDPTRVEARVRRDVAMRKHTHEKMNAERKLTDEQRREKVETKKVDQEKRGIFGAGFQVCFSFSSFRFCFFIFYFFYPNP
jgi:U4/U6 small nuclear ribonucleoprotein PRP3